MCRLAFLLFFPLLLLQVSADDLHDRFDKAEKQLRSEDAAERDEGSAALEAIAKEAPELVLPLAKDADPEVKGRASKLLKRLHLLFDSPAEQLLWKVEQKYTDAKTVQYKVALHLSLKDAESDSSVSVAAKAPNMYAFSTSGRDRETDFEVEAICDGKRLRYLLNGVEPRIHQDWNLSDEVVRAGFVRVGHYEVLSVLGNRTPMNPEEKFPVQELKSEVDQKVGERVASVISYSATVDGEDKTWQEKVWIDAEKMVVLKREGTRSDGVTVTEIYSATKFDEEIPDERFALSKEK